MSGPRLARLTPSGPAGVALLALEGPGASALLRGRFQPRGAWPTAGRLAVGRLLDAAGALLDEVVLARAGEEAYELGCHGGPAHLRRLVAALEAAGAQPGDEPAPAGDDPLRAAALAALPTATTALGAQVLLRQAGGRLRDALATLDAALAAGDAAEARARLGTLLDQLPLGRALLEPSPVALLGLPSAGKSSLLNALLGRERALVSPRPGTTRDLLETPLELAGLPLRLVDAAGVRASDDPLEAEGVRRARGAAAGARLRLVVIDAAAPDEAAWALAAAAPAPRLVLLNKVDLLAPEATAALAARASARLGEAPLPISARTGQGLPALAAALRERLVGPADPEGPVPFAPAHAAALKAVAAALERHDPAGARAALAPLLAGARP